MNLENLADDVFGRLSRSAEETVRLTELASIVSEIQVRGKRWVDETKVTLIPTSVYAIRRVSYANKTHVRVKWFEHSMLARWTTNGWRDEIGFLRASTDQLDGIQIWV